MNRKILLIFLLLMSMFIGWFFGYIKVPFVERSNEFFVGFSVSFAIILFVILLQRLLGNQNSNELFDPVIQLKLHSEKKWLARAFILFVVLSIGLLIFSVYVYLNKLKLVEKLNQTQTELNNLINDTATEDQKSKLIFLQDLIRELDSLKIKKADTPVVKNIITRMVALSNSLKIHKTWDRESTSYKKLSSIKGVLLLALVNTNLDSGIWTSIKQNVSFSGADLRNADFHNQDLSGIDLKHADLEYANLQATKFDNAELKYANMIGVNLNNASLVDANMISAKLNWAKINEANLQTARLDSADLSNAILLKSTLKAATLIQTNLNNAMLNESDLNYCSLLGASFSNANLSKVVLTNVTVNGTHFSGAILNEVIISKNWLGLLEDDHNNALNAIREKYQLVSDKETIKDSTLYRLVLKIK